MEAAGQASRLKGVWPHSKHLVHARRLFVSGGRQPGGRMLGRCVLDGEARAPAREALGVQSAHARCPTVDERVAQTLDGVRG